MSDPVEGADSDPLAARIGEALAIADARGDLLVGALLSHCLDMLGPPRGDAG